jgi:hypothetical protein
MQVRLSTVMSRRALGNSKQVIAASSALYEGAYPPMTNSCCCGQFDLNPGAAASTRLVQRIRSFYDQGFKLEVLCFLEKLETIQTKLEIGAQMQAQILSLRDQQPAWGGRKLKRRLEDLGTQRVPAASTITEILRRNGQVNIAHPSAQGPWQRFEYAALNELWQMDFKGLIRTVDRQVCHPLTVLDDHSRFNLAIEACHNQQGETVKERLGQVLAVTDCPIGSCAITARPGAALKPLVPTQSSVFGCCA